MKCPFCNSNKISVIDSRDAGDNKIIRRRRACSNCNGRFTTFERIEIKKIFVIKRTGFKKNFDRNKIFKSISTAMRKRNFSEEYIEKLTDKIVIKVESTVSREIKSKMIGKLIMQELEKIDHVSYIRFASVYKDFGTIDDFIKFIGKIKR